MASGKATEVAFFATEASGHREGLAAAGYSYDGAAQAWYVVVPAAQGKAYRSALVAMGADVANGSTYEPTGRHPLFGARR